MDPDELEELADRIENLDCGGMSEWEDGYASGVQKAAQLVREVAESISAAPPATP